MGFPLEPPPERSRASTGFGRVARSWTDEIDLGGKTTSDITAVQVPGTNVLRLFYRGPAGGVLTRWRNPDETWSQEQDLGGGPSGTGRHRAASAS
jgi:hypothetical protein